MPRGQPVQANYLTVPRVGVRFLFTALKVLISVVLSSDLVPGPGTFRPRVSLWHFSRVGSTFLNFKIYHSSPCLSLCLSPWKPSFFKQKLQTTTTLMPPENQERTDLEILSTQCFFSKGSYLILSKLMDLKLNINLISSRNAVAYAQMRRIK